MIHELRTYTLRPGSVPTVIENSGAVARRIRANDYGKLEGYWSTEIGALNQVVHLWSYDDLNERQRLRKALGENPEWVNEYLPLILPHLLKQEIRLLQPLRPLGGVSTTGNIYEYRNYRCRVGTVKAWSEKFIKALPAREKYSPNLGTWVTEAGQPNEVSHLWVYPDLNARAQARADAAKDPQWQAFLGDGPSMLEQMQSTVMLPAPFSPLQ
ncbi:MAG: NIPSNAP family protein [Gammaproteobacteria bacterium]|nr:NIPSNAP family protein [Gammaproteobacteria bacterium]